MKLLFTIFLSFSFSICCVSQIQFFEENANWKHLFSGLAGYGFVETINTDIDTIIDEKTYQIFDRIYYSQNSFTNERDTIRESFFLRDEENVLYKYDIDEEKKLIDFNLNVGDTIDFLDLRYYGDNAIVTVSGMGLDTFQGVELNFQSIRIVANGQIFGVKFREKIGTTFQSLFVNEAVDLVGDAPLHRLCSYSSASNLNYESDEQYCSNLNDFISDNKLLVKDISIKITPNPNFGEFYIETNLNQNLSYKLLDTRGIVILKGDITGPKTQVDSNNLNSNLYFLIVENENLFEVKKIFINR